MTSGGHIPRAQQAKTARTRTCEQVRSGVTADCPAGRLHPGVHAAFALQRHRDGVSPRSSSPPPPPSASVLHFMRPISLADSGLGAFRPQQTIRCNQPRPALLSGWHSADTTESQPPTAPSPRSHSSMARYSEPGPHPGSERLPQRASREATYSDLQRAGAAPREVPTTSKGQKPCMQAISRGPDQTLPDRTGRAPRARCTPHDEPSRTIQGALTESTTPPSPRRHRQPRVRRPPPPRNSEALGASPLSQSPPWT